MLSVVLCFHFPNSVCLLIMSDFSKIITFIGPRCMGEIRISQPHGNKLCDGFANRCKWLKIFFVQQDSWEDDDEEESKEDDDEKSKDGAHVVKKTKPQKNLTKKIAEREVSKNAYVVVTCVVINLLASDSLFFHFWIVFISDWNRNKKRQKRVNEKRIWRPKKN